MCARRHEEVNISEGHEFIITHTALITRRDNLIDKTGCQNDITALDKDARYEYVSYLKK